MVLARQFNSTGGAWVSVYLDGGVFGLRHVDEAANRDRTRSMFPDMPKPVVEEDTATVTSSVKGGVGEGKEEGGDEGSLTGEGGEGEEGADGEADPEASATAGEGEGEEDEEDLTDEERAEREAAKQTRKAENVEDRHGEDAELHLDGRMSGRAVVGRCAVEDPAHFEQSTWPMAQSHCAG